MKMDDWFLDLLIKNQDDPEEFARMCIAAGITDLKDAYEQVRARKDFLATF